MSEFHVRVIQIGEIEKHPNADSLSITNIEGYPVVFNHTTSKYKTGDLAVYIPIDSIVPDTEEWAFLEGHRRIRAKKLRGIFSMGMLAPLPSTIRVNSICIGLNLQKELGIVKYEPNNDGHLHQEVILDEATIIWNKKPLWQKLLTRRFWKQKWFKFVRKFEKPEISCTQFPIYTDIEGLRKYMDILIEGEEVIITEKTHGQNGRFGKFKNKFYVGSHNFFKRKPGKGDKPNNWWSIAEAYVLDELLPHNTGFYGEVYGTVQKGFSYDAAGKLAVRFFDIRDFSTGRYMDYDKFESVCNRYGLPMMPVLYRGPWKKELIDLAEGKSTFGNHIREGFVVRPVKERHDDRVGRVIFKMVGQGYLLSKHS